MTGHFVADDRELSTHERALLRALLGATEAGRAYLPQADSVRVVSHCGCGCRTIDLSPSGAKEAHTGPSTVVASAPATSPEGVPLDLLVHVRDGVLAELEIYAQDASEKFSLPLLAELELWHAV
jgi:hypothetical protein